MEIKPASDKQDHVEVIDFLRGVAVLLVFFFHCRGFIAGGETGSSQTVFAYMKEVFHLLIPFSFGWSGVQFFLLISGFVIHQSAFKGIDFKGFFTRRIFRIYPLYLIFLVFYFGFEGNVFDFKDLMLHTFLIHNLFDDTFFTIGPQFWSLGLEFQLYLLYFLSHRLLLRHFQTSLLVSVFISAIVSIYILQTGIVSPALSNSVAVLGPVWLAGADLSNRFRNGRLFRFSSFFLIGFFLLIKAMEFWALPGLIFSFLYSFLYYGVFSEMLFWQKIPRFGRLISYLGLISYGVYLAHVAILKIVPDLSLYNLTNFSRWFILLDIGIALLVTVMVSDFLYRNIELPFIQAGRKIIRNYLS